MFGQWQALANIFGAKKANKTMAKVLEQDPTYTENPLAAKQYGFANNLFNARMFGAPEQERNILANQAGYNAQIDKGATDAATALALKAAGQGETNNAFQQLQLQEKQNKYGLLSNLNNAYATMIGEGDKVYEDKVRKFGNYAAIKGGQQANLNNALTGIFNGLNSDFNDAVNIFSLGQGGNMFGGGQRQVSQNANPISIPGYDQYQRYKRR